MNLDMRAIFRLFLSLSNLMAVRRIFFSDLCWRKAMNAHTRSQHGKKEECERLKGKGDHIRQVVGFRRGRREQEIAFFGINYDF